MIKAVWIDIDNTLLDFDAYVQTAMRDGFARFGLGVYDGHAYETFRRINTSLWHRIEKGELSYEELLRIRWNTVFDALGISFDGTVFEKYFKAYLFDSAIPVAGAVELLEYLKDRYVLCVASNGPYGQQMNRLTLGHMTPYFSHFFISERIGTSKPSEEFFSCGLAEMNAARDEQLVPSEVLFIGDSLTSDMAGAAQFGMHTCWLDRSGSGDAGEVPVDHVVHSLDGIRAFL